MLRTAATLHAVLDMPKNVPLPTVNDQPGLCMLASTCLSGPGYANDTTSLIECRSWSPLRSTMCTGCTTICCPTRSVRKQPACAHAMTALARASWPTEQSTLMPLLRSCCAVALPARACRLLLAMRVSCPPALSRPAKLSAAVPRSKGISTRASSKSALLWSIDLKMGEKATSCPSARR